MGERGRLTRCKLEALKEEEGFHFISALTHHAIQGLLDKQTIQRDLFDEETMGEGHDPDNPAQRYGLCKNPLSAQRETQTRQRLLDLTKAALEKIAHDKRRVSVETLGARVGKVLGQYKMGKFITWHIKADEDNPISNQHQLIWTLDQEKVQREQQLDGCYIITTDVSQGHRDKTHVVNAYKNLAFVEQAFRQLKTVQLEVRPVYHKKDERIKSQVFLCLLAYYVLWHREQKLSTLFEQEGQGKDRRWTVQGVIDTLKQMRRNKVTAPGVEFYQNCAPNSSQQQILALLNVNL